MACIVGYSGMLTAASELADQIVSKPPVLLIHGSADEVVPVTSLHRARKQLEGHGVKVTAHVSQGLGHSVDATGLRLGGEFVADAFVRK